MLFVVFTKVKNTGFRISIFISAGTSLAGQWLGLHAFIAKGLGSIRGQGTKIPQAMQCDQKKKIFFLM